MADQVWSTQQRTVLTQNETEHLPVGSHATLENENETVQTVHGVSTESIYMHDKRLFDQVPSSFTVE